MEASSRNSRSQRNDIRRSPGRKRGSLRVLGFVALSCLWLAACLIVAYRQSVCPEIDRRYYGILDWLAYPLEINPDRRLAELRGPLADIAASPDGGVLCVVGAGGFIATSRDRGISWQPRAVPSGLRVDEFAPAQPIPVPNRSRLDPTQAAPRSSYSAEPTTRVPHLYAVHFIDSNRGWIVGQHGTILATTDGGATWSAQRSGVAADLTCIAMWDETSGFAAGQDATGPVAMRYDGTQWQQLKAAAPPTPDAMKKEAFRSPSDPPANAAQLLLSTALMKTAGPVLLSAYTTQKAALPSPTEALQRPIRDAIALVGRDVGFLMLGERTAFYLPTMEALHPIRTFAAYHDSGGPQLVALTNEDALSGALTTWKVFATKDLTNDTVAIEPPGFDTGFTSLRSADLLVRAPTEILVVAYTPPQKAQAAYSANTLPDQNNAAEVGLRGAVLAMPVIKPGANGAANDVGVRSQELDFQPTRIAGAPPSWLWVIGEGGELIGSRDGGERWYPLSQQVLRTESPSAPLARGLYVRLPAPWALLLGCGVPLILGLVFRVRPAAEPVYRISDSPQSDKPLLPGERDVLDFQRLATGISRFLRNVNTAAPLTMSIEGPWGSGKSSLMNLIQADLARYGFRSVWFNAWHHQREDNLLAAMLEALRKHAAPSVFDLAPHVLAYRLKLWWRKMCAPGFAERLILVALLFLAAWLFFGWMKTDALGVLKSLLAALLPGVDGSATKPAELDYLKLILGGTTGAAALSQGVELVRRLATFTVNPAELLASQSRAARLPELDKQTSVRFRFAREFLDFCEAFKPRNLIVFIDDLDRCNPETTAMILECVNYLVSSGDCYIVFGMDYDRVRACIAQAYGSEARTMAELRGGVDNPTASLREFADRYLEKLVNLRIPLPRATATQRAALVVTSGADAEGRDEASAPSPSWLVQLPQAMARAIPGRLAAALVLCLGVAMLYWLPRAPSAVNSMGGPPSGGSPGTGGIPQVAGIEPTWDWPPRAVATTTTSVTGARASAVAWFLIGLGLAVLLASILMQMFTPDMGVIQDSPAFEQALRDWLPLLETKAETPRALKRFMNELRYLAMLQEPAAPRLTPWEYLLGLLGLYRPPAAATNGQCIEESSLVGLAVLHHRFPAWPASSEQIKSQAMELLNAHAVPSAKQEELRPKVAEMASHSDRFLRLLGVAKFQ